GVGRLETACHRHREARPGSSRSVRRRMHPEVVRPPGNLFPRFAAKREPSLGEVMCGIAGMLGRGDASELVRGMLDRLAHRGPDGEGLCSLAPDIALGHRRLAVLDLSDRGAQPMTSRDGCWTLVLNGEIFNYRELHRDLGELPLRSRTDTEILLEAC